MENQTLKDESQAQVQANSFLLPMVAGSYKGRRQRNTPSPSGNQIPPQSWSNGYLHFSHVVCIWHGIGGGARSVLVPAIPISGLNHVGRHIWPAPSVLGYHQVSGARACHQIQTYGHWYTEVSELTMCFSQWKSKCLAHLNKNCPKIVQKQSKKDLNAIYKIKYWFKHIFGERVGKILKLKQINVALYVAHIQHLSENIILLESIHFYVYSAKSQKELP